MRYSLKLFVFLWLLGTYGGQAQTRFYVMSTNLGIVEDAQWVFYGLSGTHGISGDAPEGGYMGFLPAAITNISNTIQLHTNLPAGVYLYHLKAQMYNNLVSPHVTFIVGGGSNTIYPTIVTNNQGQTIGYNYTRQIASGQWIGRMLITNLVASSNLTVKLASTNTSEPKLLIIGIAVSSYTNDWPQKLDLFGDFTEVTSIDTAPAASGNLLRNSGAELGFTEWWNETGGGRTNLAAQIDSATVYSGSNSFRIRADESLLSRIYGLVSNTEHRASARMKASSSVTVKLGLFATTKSSLTDSTLPPGTTTSFLTNYTTASNVTVTTSWARYDVIVNSYDFPGSEYIFGVQPLGVGPDVWVDELQLERGGLTAYAPRKAIECALDVTNELSVLDTTNGLIRCWNNTANSSNVVIVVDVYDWKNALIAVATNSTFTLAPGRTIIPVRLDFGIKGFFRALTTYGTEQHERQFSIVPQLAAIGTNSTFGIHGTGRADDYYLRGLKKANIPWQRGLSPAWDRWEQIEPVSEGVWDWTYSDLIFASLTNAGMKILNVLDWQGLKSWNVDSGQMPVLSKWSNYVWQVTNRRGTNVHAWEVKNEPLPTLTAAQYGQLLTSAVPVIRMNSPGVPIVGFGGLGSVQREWVADVVSYLGPNWETNMDAVSIHVYPITHRLNADTFEAYSNVYSAWENKLPIWNTESGIKESGPLLGARGSPIEWDSNVYPQERFTRGMKLWPQNIAWSVFLSIGLGNGGGKYFLYDGRLFSNFGDHAFSGINDDDTLRVKMSVLATMASLIDGFNASSNVTHNAMNGFVFGGGVRSATAGLWSSVRSNLNLTLTGITTNDLWRIDWMGNWSRPTNLIIRITDVPIYLVATNHTLSQFSSIVSAGTVAAVPDIQAPTLIVFKPEPAGSQWRWRYFAIDDVVTADQVSPEAVQYRASFNGGPFSAWSGVPWTINNLSGTASITVQARDSSGNITGSGTLPGIPGNLRVATLRVGQIISVP
jgi:hypothetical protein